MTLRFAFGVVLLAIVNPASQVVAWEESDPLSSMRAIEAALIAENAIRHGEAARGTKFLLKAIEFNSKDLGNYCIYGRKPNSEDLDWGERQVTQLLVDRPILTEIVKDRNEVWHILCAEFGGGGRSSPVSWNSRPPEFANAEFNISTPTEPASIQVAGELLDATTGAMSPRSAEEILCGVVFELRNASRSQSFELLYKLAREGSISKEVFVERMYAMELETMQEVRGFYAKSLLPLAVEVKLATDPDIWYVQSRFWLPTSALFFDAHENKGEYPWVPYAEYYDVLRKGAPSGAQG